MSPTSPPTPLVLAAAPNGARAGKADHPALPITRDEIVEACLACVEAGATMLHVHVRAPDGRHILDAEAARALEAALLRRLGDRALVQTTTEAAGRYAAPEQAAFLRAARPRAVSLAWREIARPELSDSERAGLLAWCSREAVALQYILYDAADAAALDHAVRRGIVPDAEPRILYVVGRYGEDAADPEALDAFAPASATWMACAFGAQGHSVLDAAARAGGHLRIGFENGFACADGRIARDNGDLVQDVLARIPANRRPATPDESRRILGLS